MNIKYNYKQVATGDIDIDNVGTCCLVANDDLGNEWYIYISTDMGKTVVITAGPYCPDILQFPPKVSCNYQCFDYAQGKIEKILDKILNGNPVTQVREVDTNVLQELFPDFKSQII